MSNKRAYAVVLRKGHPAEPVTLQQLSQMMKQGKLNDTDHIRRGIDAKWEPVGQAVWLRDLMDRSAGAADMDANENEPMSDDVPLAAKSTRPNKNMLLYGVLLMAFVVISVIGYTRSRGGSGESGAKSYVEKELSAWRAGKDTELCDSLFGTGQLILVDYTTVDTEKNEVFDNAYDVTVQLTFTTRAGGRPLELHTFTVENDGGGWAVMGSTKYFH